MRIFGSPTDAWPLFASVVALGAVRPAAAAPSLCAEVRSRISEFAAQSAHPDAGPSGYAAPAPLAAECVPVAAAELDRLAKTGTQEAARALVQTYASYGDVLRGDLDRGVRVLGDRALPALVEARRSEARGLRLWAGKELEALGKDVPGEAVQTGDPKLLAELLRAYGRARDADAARVVASFLNHDTLVVRDAARAAALDLGAAETPVLSEMYANLTGRRPDATWAGGELARQLFHELDRVRLSDVSALLDEGLEAERAGDLPAMAQAFDRVLARSPDFERRGETAEGYLVYARALESTDRPRALDLARRAERLAPPGPGANLATAERLYLEALDLRDRQLADPAAFEAVLRLDPAHARARAALELTRARDARATRLLALSVLAGLAALAALAASVRTFWRRAALARSRRS